MPKVAVSSVDALTRHMARAVETAAAYDEPFFHLVLDRIFPEDLYAEIISDMPSAKSFRATPGRQNENIRLDGSSTRVKVELFPELTMHMRGRQRDLWATIGEALRSNEVREAFVRRLEPGLERRFGGAYSANDFYPIPVLTRDTSGYRIPEHTDTHWKAITVQLYLPRDHSLDGIGTVFSEQRPDRKFRRVKQMQFIPNHGYAFAVGDNTWHSVDDVGELPVSRDSIILTYIVDRGARLKLRNRAKRVLSFLGNESRRAVGKPA